MGLLRNSKPLPSRGNVVDMAVGIIIGAAFGKIVSSFVGDGIMPPIGLLDRRSRLLRPGDNIEGRRRRCRRVVLAYGKFIQTILDFVIVAFAIFRGSSGDQPPQAQRSRRAVRTASAECRGNPADRDPRSAESPAEQVVIASAEHEKGPTGPFIAGQLTPGSSVIPPLLRGHRTYQ